MSKSRILFHEGKEKQGLEQLNIKQELPSVHITFPNADSESDPMLILLYISGLVHWQQSRQDRT